MGEALQTPQGLRIPVLRLEHDMGLQLLHDPRLPGDAELGGKIALNMGNGFDRIFHGAHRMA